MAALSANLFAAGVRAAVYRLLSSQLPEILRLRPVTPEELPPVPTKEKAPEPKVRCADFTSRILRAPSVKK